MHRLMVANILVSQNTSFQLVSGFEKLTQANPIETAQSQGLLPSV